MKKALYSLILSEEVVKEVDRLAAAANTNRSNYVNQILAERVAYLTPEKKINNIFNKMFALLDNAFETRVEENDTTLNAKSVLDYKYRPAMNYSVQLYRAGGEALGELRVTSRSQSEELLRGLTRFFRLIAEMESLYLSKYFKGKQIRFEISEGRLSRVFRLPETDDEQSLSRAISAYVNMFDKLLKGYIGGDANSFELEKEYVAYLNGANVII